MMVSLVNVEDRALTLSSRVEESNLCHLVERVPLCRMYHPRKDVHETAVFKTAVFKTAVLLTNHGV